MSYILNFDKTAASPANYITDEVYNLTSNKDRLIVPTHGKFYSDDFVIKNGTTNAVIPDTEYDYVGLDVALSATTGGKNVISGFMLSESIAGSVSSIKITYRALGGKEGNSGIILEKLLQAIEEANLNAVVDFSDVANLPATYPPDPHNHNMITDLTNLHPLREALNDLTEALTSMRPVNTSQTHIWDTMQRLLYVMISVRNDLNRVTRVIGSDVTMGDLDDYLKKANLDAEATALTYVKAARLSAIGLPAGNNYPANTYPNLNPGSGATIAQLINAIDIVIGNLGGAAYAEVTDFAQAAHSHDINDVDGLAAALAQVGASLNLGIADIDGLSAALANKANSTHSHLIQDIANLQAILDSKAQNGHTHQVSDIEGFGSIQFANQISSDLEEEDIRSRWSRIATVSEHNQAATLLLSGVGVDRDLTYLITIKVTAANRTVVIRQMNDGNTSSVPQFCSTYETVSDVDGLIPDYKECELWIYCPADMADYTITQLSQTIEMVDEFMDPTATKPSPSVDHAITTLVDISGVATVFKFSVPLGSISYYNEVHEQSVAPDIVNISYKCISPNAGQDAGDFVTDIYCTATATNSRAVAAEYDNLSIALIVTNWATANDLQIMNRAGGEFISIDRSKWEVHVTAVWYGL